MRLICVSDQSNTFNKPIVDPKGEILTYQLFPERECKEYAVQMVRVMATTHTINLKLWDSSYVDISRGSNLIVDGETYNSPELLDARGKVQNAAEEKLKELKPNLTKIEEELTNTKKTLNSSRKTIEASIKSMQDLINNPPRATSGKRKLSAGLTKIIKGAAEAEVQKIAELKIKRKELRTEKKSLEKTISELTSQKKNAESLKEEIIQRLYTHLDCDGTLTVNMLHLFGQSIKANPIEKIQLAKKQTKKFDLGNGEKMKGFSHQVSHVSQFSYINTNKEKRTFVLDHELVLKQQIMSEERIPQDEGTVYFKTKIQVEGTNEALKSRKVKELGLKILVTKEYDSVDEARQADYRHIKGISEEEKKSLLT